MVVHMVGLMAQLRSRQCRWKLNKIGFSMRRIPTPTPTPAPTLTLTLTPD